MTAFNDVARPAGAGSDPLSRPELERLEALRRTPAPLRVLTPDGAQHVDAGLDRQREVRIQTIAESLDNARGQAVGEFARASVRGKATYDFDRTR